MFGFREPATRREVRCESSLVVLELAAAPFRDAGRFQTSSIQVKPAHRSSSLRFCTTFLGIRLSSDAALTIALLFPLFLFISFHCSRQCRHFTLCVAGAFSFEVLDLSRFLVGFLLWFLRFHFRGFDCCNPFLGFLYLCHSPFDLPRFDSALP